MNQGKSEASNERLAARSHTDNIANVKMCVCVCVCELRVILLRYLFARSSRKENAYIVFKRDKAQRRV